jgi:protein Tex
VVTNVAAFGAFVDVGVHQDGLVHVSAMSKNFVSDPHSVVRSGDVVRVKVLSVDVPRHRISLTLRLDDEGPRQAGGRDRSSRTGTASSPRATPNRPAGGDRKGEAPQPQDSALADALRRAGLAPTGPKPAQPPKPSKGRGDRPGRR